MIREPVLNLRETQFSNLQNSNQALLNEPMMTPKVILVGPSMRVNEVAAELKSSGLEVIRTNFVKEMKEAVDFSVAAVIYVMPLKRSHVLSVHKNVQRQKEFRRIPFFVIAPHWTSDRSEREMYKLGIRMIFEWPREKKSFSELFLSALTSPLAPIRSEDTDESLKGAIENRILTEFGGFRPPLNVVVYRGIALLRGQVGSLQLKKNLVKTVKSIPGVRGLVDQSLRVARSPLPALNVKQEANRMLRDSYGFESRTLEVEVDDKTGCLILRGTVAGSRKVREVIARLEQMHGITRIIDQTEVSEKVHRKDRVLAKRAERLVKKTSLSPRTHVRVKVLMGEVLLKGSVGNRIEKSHITQALRTLDGVKSVEDKMTVANTV